MTTVRLNTRTQTHIHTLRHIFIHSDTYSHTHVLMHEDMQIPTQEHIHICTDIHMSAHNQDMYNKKQSQNLRNLTMMNRNNLIREHNL